MVALACPMVPSDPWCVERDRVSGWSHPLHWDSWQCSSYRPLLCMGFVLRTPEITSQVAQGHLPFSCQGAIQMHGAQQKGSAEPLPCFQAISVTTAKASLECTPSCPGLVVSCRSAVSLRGVCWSQMTCFFHLCKQE
jgi:hypothetical protein